MKLKKTLTLETMNQKLVGIDYAVRGPVVQRAYEIEDEMKQGVKMPFERVIRANIGDCHALGQKPITFVRQVVAVAACPQLMRSPDIPEDVKERAQEVLDECVQGSVGAYSPAPGLPCVRARVARHLQERDGVAAAPGDVLLGAGVTDLVRALLAMFAQDVHGKPTGVMVPTPQYPLFSGSLTELGLRRVDYVLDESHDWALTVSELERSWRAARHDCCVRVLVVINPGNPTGKVLERENMEEIIKFAYERNLFLLSDEVYLESVVTKPFIAFRKVVHEMGAPYSSIEMASFLSASKGWTCEAGLRCGAMELRGVSPRVMRAYNVANTLRQCPSVLGQCVMLCAVYPPEPEDPSYETFSKELEVIRRPLKHRALQAEIAFNKIPGYFCSPIEGGLFAFPRFDLPPRALEAAKKARMPPDDFYCLQMLEETGVCVVPGSGFGQQPGTYHYRITVLHSRQELDFMITSIDRFHRKFLQTYS